LIERGRSSFCDNEDGRELQRAARAKGVDAHEAAAR